MKWDGYEVAPHLSSAEVLSFQGRECLRVQTDPSVVLSDEPTFARITGAQVRNGTIEVKVLSRLQPGAPAFARGFIGVAFRAAEDCGRFEGLYVRPTNGRVDDPVRRTRAAQYFGFPDYKYDKLRQDFPGRFEAGADIGLDEWIALRVELAGTRAQLFVNGGAEPVLDVAEAFHGTGAGVGVALWVGEFTEGYFADLKLTSAG